MDISNLLGMFGGGNGLNLPFVSNNNFQNEAFGYNPFKEKPNSSQNKNFAENLNNENAQKNNANFSQNNMISSLLPLLMGGGNMEQSNIMEMLTKSNPNLTSIMSMLPKMEQTNTTKPKKPSYKFVKVKDYYENN